MKADRITILNLTVKELEELISSAVQNELKQLISQSTSTNGTSLITRKDAARLLNISLPTLTKHIKSGAIPARRIGNKILFDRSELIKSLVYVQKLKLK